MADILIKQIEAQLNCKVTHQQMVGGGCIAQTSIIHTNNNASYFLKQGFSGTMFRKEANGLAELNKAKAIRIPDIVLVDDNFLLLESIETGSKTNSFFTDFGKAFARLHHYKNASFGFYEDNFIGSSPQINQQADNWTDFYMSNRLLYQFKMAEQNGYVDAAFRKQFNHIEKLLPKIIDGSDEAPCLLHGDLWGGNYMVDRGSNPVLIDPAVYYGHREADLAMTKLFGGFSPDFYEAYNEEYPLLVGYKYRENIYLLYHVLNHLNLFGTSYKHQAMQLMSSYI